MKFNIFPQRQETYNCYDNNIISIICQCYDKDISIYFLDDFGFKHDEFNMYNKYKVATSSDYGKMLLNEYLGIQLNYMSKDNISYTEFKTDVNYNIKTIGLVGIIADSYDCPWNEKYYQTIHMSHAVMITDSDKEECTCFDAYFSVKSQKVSMMYLYSIMHEMIFFKIRESNVDYKSIREMIRKKLVEEKQDRKSRILSYAKMLGSQNVEELYRETQGDINASSLVFSVSEIWKSRHNFRFALECNQIPLDIDNEVIDKLDKLCKKWELVKNLIIMGIYRRNKNYFKRLMIVLSDIANEEDAIIDCLCCQKLG